MAATPVSNSQERLEGLSVLFSDYFSFLNEFPLPPQQQQQKKLILVCLAGVRGIAHHVSRRVLDARRCAGWCRAALLLSVWLELRSGSKQRRRRE